MRSDRLLVSKEDAQMYKKLGFRLQESKAIQGTMTAPVWAVRIFRRKGLSALKIAVASIQERKALLVEIELAAL